MSFFVFFLYSFTAALKIVSKPAEEGEEGGTPDMVLVTWSSYGVEGLQL